jgi:hypothetical protein
MTQHSGWKVAWVAGLCLAGSSAVHAFNGGVIQATTQASDLFAPGGATTIDDSHSATLAPLAPGSAVQADAWYADSNSPWRGGGTAYARAEEVGHELKFGAAALARSWGGLTGTAHGHVEAQYDITVEYLPPADPIIAALWVADLQRRGCLGFQGCQLNETFQHITRGRLAYGAYSTDRSASFEERLTLTGMDTLQYGGRLDLGYNPSRGPGVVLGVSGDWDARDLTAFGPTPASQLNLFPDGDPRNALPDPSGDLAGFDFLRWEIIADRPGLFRFANPFSSVLVGTFHATLLQDASAAEGSDSYNFSTLAVDFAHTSALSVVGVTDPLGEIDFSQATMNVYFGSPVPEPTSWLLLLLGLPAIGSRRMARRQRH